MAPNKLHQSAQHYCKFRKQSYFTQFFLSTSFESCYCHRGSPNSADFGVKSVLNQGRLKIWTEHSTLILLILIPFKVGQQFQNFYNLGRNEFSPNLKGVAQKLGLPRPFEVLDVFGGKSKSKAPKAFKFGTKRVSIEVYNW